MALKLVLITLYPVAPAEPAVPFYIQLSFDSLLLQFKAQLFTLCTLILNLSLLNDYFDRLIG